MTQCGEDGARGTAGVVRFANGGGPEGGLASDEARVGWRPGHSPAAWPWEGEGPGGGRAGRDGLADAVEVFHG